SGGGHRHRSRGIPREQAGRAGGAPPVRRRGDRRRALRHAKPTNGRTSRPLPRRTAVSPLSRRHHATSHALGSGRPGCGSAEGPIWLRGIGQRALPDAIVGWSILMKFSQNALRVAAGIAALVAAAATPGWAAAQDTTRSSDPPGASDTTKIDPDALAALESMGAYLRTLKSFGGHAVITTGNGADDGEKAQLPSPADLVAERPNRMRVDIADQRQPRTLFYDGKTFTMWAPRVKFYASIAAPPSIIQLVDTL